MTLDEALRKHRQQAADQSTQNKRSSVVNERKYNECRENTTSRKLKFKRYS